MNIPIRPIAEIDSFGDALNQIIPQAIDDEGNIPIELIHYLLLAHQSYSMMKMSEAFEREAEHIHQKPEEGRRNSARSQSTVFKSQHYPILIARSLVLLQKNIELFLNPKEETGANRSQKEKSVISQEDKRSEKSPSHKKGAKSLDTARTKLSEAFVKLMEKLSATEQKEISAKTPFSQNFKSLFFQLHQLVLLTDLLKNRPNIGLYKNPELQKQTTTLTKTLQSFVKLPEIGSFKELHLILSHLYRFLESTDPTLKIKPNSLENKKQPAIISSSTQIKGNAEAKPITLAEQPALKTALLNLIGKASIPQTEARQIQNLVAKMPLAFIVPHQKVSPFELRKKSKKAPFQTPDEAWKREEEDCEENPCEE